MGKIHRFWQHETNGNPVFLALDLPGAPNGLGQSIVGDWHREPRKPMTFSWTLHIIGSERGGYSDLSRKLSDLNFFSIRKETISGNGDFEENEKQ